MQQTSTEGIQEQAHLDGQSDPLGIVQATKIWSYRQMIYAQTRISPGK